MHFPQDSYVTHHDWTLYIKTLIKGNEKGKNGDTSHLIQKPLDN